MKIQTLLILIALSLTGCGRDAQESPAAGESRVSAGTAVSTPIDYESIGKEEAYELACANCHADGENGAPIPGKRDDWENRSPLWDAVLLEHATSGFFAMPAKGGHEELPDFVVERAAEYMLELTFPERRPD